MSTQAINIQIAKMIQDARTKAGLTQKQLAESVGTTQSSIARLEDPEYGGHTVSTLGRIAAVLNLQLDVRFVRNKN